MHGCSIENLPGSTPELISSNSSQTLLHGSTDLLTKTSELLPETTCETIAPVSSAESLTNKQSVSEADETAKSPSVQSKEAAIDTCKDTIREKCESPQPGTSKETVPVSKQTDGLPSGRRNSNSSCSSRNASDNEDSSNISSEDSSSSESEKHNRNGKKTIRKPNATNALRKACESLMGLLKRRREKENAVNKPAT